MMKTICVWMLAILAAAGCQPQGRPRYTVLLAETFSPEYHVEWAESLKEMTERDTDWPDLRIVHGEQMSELLCGRYVTLAQAERQLARVKRYRSPDGQPVYPNPKVMPLPPLKIGSPEFDLENAEGFWTLVIAEFNDDVNAPGHEEAALAYCRELRDQGQQAYYWNQPLKSYVAIGALPEGAYGYAVQEGRRVGPYILDQGLAQLRQKFPDLAVNGHQELRRYFDSTTNRQERAPAPSYVTQIPKATADHDQDDFAGQQ